MSKLISKIVVPDSNEATGYSLYNVKDSGAIHSSDVGVAGGVASLDNAGKVPSSLLPSYVDDVVEGYYHENKFYTTYTPGEQEEDPGTYSGEITAETGKIYVDIPTNQSYRWSGSAYIVISSPYVLPTASANTLGGVKVGDNLSIDQNGVLSAQASSPDEVQIGGNTPSSDSDIKIFIDTTEDSTAEIYTKQQQDGKFIVIKDLNAAPTESTLTYTENGTVKNFKQGDEVRVPDQDADNGYTFYKLYELTTSGNTTTATWDKLGAGEGTAYGTIIVNLEAYENDVKISLNFSGTQVTLTNTTDSQIVATRTLSSGDASASFYNVTPLKDYLISVSDIDTFVTPDDISILNLAFGVTDVETMLYIKEDYVYVTIDQTQSDYNSMITVSNKIGGNALILNTSTGIHQNSALLKLRNSSHLYLGTYANSKMTLKQLKDDDGTKYLDGTTANMLGSQGDHFLRIGEPFYIKRVAGSDNADQVTYGICVGRLPDNTWKQLITPNDLLGVHLAYANNNMLYSISNLTPSNIAISNFLQYAHNRGTGYICITWEWHCVMALLFWAWYSNTNARIQCGNGGPGGNSRTTGLKDSFGMTDTTSSNGNTNNVKFWGIEDLWGNTSEISENVKLKYVNSTTKLWQVTDIKTGTSRTLPAIIRSSLSFISRLLLSENLDLIPTSTDGGTDSTYYCTSYNTSDTSVTQDCYGSFSGPWCLNWNGVTTFGADRTGDFSHGSIGSRLAYNGQIEIINN